MVEIENPIAIIKRSSEIQELESIGKTLDSEQFIALLDAISEHAHKFNGKLSPILVGISPLIFEKSLAFMTPKHVEALRHEAAAAPLQHLLTLLAHEYETLWVDISIVRAKLLKLIGRMDLESVTRQELNDIKDETDNKENFINERLDKINVALALAWNSSRVDLVERFSLLKENFISITDLKQQVEEKLKHHLDTVFGNPEKEIEAVSDDDPAIEGLAKFSLWYPEDYWEIGLLPEIQTREELYPNGDSSSEERTKELMSEVTVNLARIGLRNVSDLKMMQIFSKKLLQEFIADNR
jgi:hypothetical protein